jgi:hypothetical protein
VWGFILGRCVQGGVLDRSVFVVLNWRVLAVLNKGVVLEVLILDGLVHGRLVHNGWLTVSWLTVGWLTVGSLTGWSGPARSSGFD